MTSGQSTSKQAQSSQPPTPRWVKHQIECNCILPQFKAFIGDKTRNIPFHRFVVFSELRPDGSVKPSYAQCGNCNAVHKIIEVNKSEFLRREEMSALPDIDEIKQNLPEQIVGFLKKYDCPIATWQHAEFVFKHSLWGDIIILSRERENPADLDSKIVTKYLLVIGENLWKLYTDSEEDLEGIQEK